MTNRIGPNLPEPGRGARGAGAPDSEKFGKEMKKVEKIEKVGEVELEKRNKRALYQVPDEDEKEIEPSPYDPAFKVPQPKERSPMALQTPKPPPGFEDLAAQDVPTPAKTPMPALGAKAPAEPLESQALPKSEYFYYETDTPYSDKKPTALEEKHPTASAMSAEVKQKMQEQSPTADGKSSKQNQKEKESASKESEYKETGQTAPRSFKPTDGKAGKAKGTDGAEKPAGSTKGWTADLLHAADKKEEPRKSSWLQDTEGPASSERPRLSKGAESLGPPSSEPLRLAKGAESGKASAFKKEKEQQDQAERAMPGQLPPQMQADGRVAPIRGDDEADQEKGRKAVPRWREPDEVIGPLPDEKRRKEFLPPTQSEKEKEEGATRPSEEKERGIHRDREKKQQRLWESDESSPESPARAAQIDKELDREREEDKEKQREADIMALQPPDPLPQNAIAAAQAAMTTPVASYLGQEAAMLFQQMVGTIVYMASASPGVMRTEFLLNAESFRNSIFFNTTVTVERYATAPDSFNIRLTGSPEAIRSLSQNMNALTGAFAAAYDERRIAFRIGRIETSLATDRPLIRRKKGAGDKGDGGESERGKQ